MKIPIIFEDNHLLVVEKPPNLLSQADQTQDDDLLTLLKAYLVRKYQKPNQAFLALVQRLDRPVGGVLVLAKTSKAAKRLNQQQTQQAFTKTYLAIVQGVPDPLKAQLTDYLFKDTKNNLVKTTTAKLGKRAELAYQVLASTQQLSLIKIQLLTGRSHQIRVQLASRNYPLWGDQRYNPNATAGEQIALWSSQLSFNHPTTQAELTFNSLPKMGYPWSLFERNIYENLSLSKD